MPLNDCIFCESLLHSEIQFKNDNEENQKSYNKTETPVGLLAFPKSGLFKTTNPLHQKPASKYFVWVKL